MIGYDLILRLVLVYRRDSRRFGKDVAIFTQVWLLEGDLVGLDQVVVNLKLSAIKLAIWL